MTTPISLNPYVGGGSDAVGAGGGNPIGAVTADNAQRGVKRGLLGNPVNVPSQLPGFRGRIVDAGGPVRAPKPRNGNLNNSTSNIRVPYNRVAPLEFLSSYTGRLSPGDVVFVSKYAPGFVGRKSDFNHQINNATLGVNTMTRVVGLDGLNRLLMGSNPQGWQVDLNVLWLNEQPNFNQQLPPTAVSSGSNTAQFKLSVLDEYRLDGLVISNDEPGTFTSSGSRDNALFNVAIQGCARARARALCFPHASSRVPFGAQSPQAHGVQQRIFVVRRQARRTRPSRPVQPSHRNDKRAHG